MNWEAISAISDTVGSIAVIATIGFLAFQVKSNTAVIKTTGRQNVANEFKETSRLMMDNAEHFALGLRDYPDVPFDALSKFSGAMVDVLMSFQSCLASHKAGMLEDHIYQSYLTFTASFLVTAGGKAYWIYWRNVYIKEMVDELDKRIAQGGLGDIRQVPQFNIDNANQHKADIATP
ncbi:MAG: hypothetical protein V7682_01820 [Cycloclasticus sp.]